MKVELQSACFLGEGKDRKGYGVGSVVEVSQETYELNSSWMKPVDAKIHAVPYNPEAKADKDK
jgi:hypothetical protein